jgi:hypothetical protein
MIERPILSAVLESFSVGNVALFTKFNDDPKFLAATNSKEVVMIDSDQSQSLKEYEMIIGKIVFLETTIFENDFYGHPAGDKF